MFNLPDDIRRFDSHSQSPLYVEPDIKGLDERIEDLVGDDCFDFVEAVGVDEINSIIGYHLNGDSKEMGSDLARAVRNALIHKIGCESE